MGKERAELEGPCWRTLLYEQCPRRSGLEAWTAPARQTLVCARRPLPAPFWLQVKTAFDGIYPAAKRWFEGQLRQTPSAERDGRPTCRLPTRTPAGKVSEEISDADVDVKSVRSVGASTEKRDEGVTLSSARRWIRLRKTKTPEVAQGRPVNTAKRIRPFVRLHSKHWSSKTIQKDGKKLIDKPKTASQGNQADGWSCHSGGWIGTVESWAGQHTSASTTGTNLTTASPEEELLNFNIFARLPSTSRSFSPPSLLSSTEQHPASTFATRMTTNESEDTNKPLGNSSTTRLSGDVSGWAPGQVDATLDRSAERWRKMRVGLTSQPPPPEPLPWEADVPWELVQDSGTNETVVVSNSASRGRQRDQDVALEIRIKKGSHQKETGSRLQLLLGSKDNNEVVEVRLKSGLPRCKLWLLQLKPRPKFCLGDAQTRLVFEALDDEEVTVASEGATSTSTCTSSATHRTQPVTFASATTPASHVKSSPCSEDVIYVIVTPNPMKFNEQPLRPVTSRLKFTPLVFKLAGEETGEGVPNTSMAGETATTSRKSRSTKRPSKPKDP